MKRDKSILGIHIDDGFLNIVHLGRTEDGLSVHGRAVEPLEAGVVKDGLIVHIETISQKIRNFVKAGQPKVHKAIISLSCSAVRLRPSEFEAQTDEQLEKHVEDQIKKYALFGNEEIVFDYCTFEETARLSNKQTVLQAVITRRISDACSAAARGAKLDLVRIEPAVLPVMKLTCDKLPAESGSVSLLLALDSASGNLSVFKNGLPQFCQNLSIGIKDVSQREDGFTHLIDQMKPVLEFARSVAGPASAGVVLRVAAAGSSEKLRTIAERIKQSLPDVAVEQIDPARVAEKFGIKEVDGVDLPIFALACALTAPGICEFAGQINLVSQKSLAREKTRKEMSLTTKAIVAIVLLSVAAKIGLNMEIRSVEADLTGVEAKITEAVPMSQKITGLKKQIKELKQKQLVYAATSRELTDIPWPKALQVIAETMPRKVRIVDIYTTDSADFTLIGEALLESDVHRFARQLQNAEFIESAKVEEIEYDDSGAESVVDYKITCKIQLPESDL